MRQAHLQLVADRHEARFGFRSRSPYPGVAEVDDRNDRRAGIDDFSLWRRPHRYRAAHRSVNLRVAQSGIGLCELSARVGQLRFVHRHIAGGCALLIDACLRGIDVGLGRIHVLLRAVHQRLLRIELLLRAYAVLIGGYALLRQLHGALRVALNAYQVSPRLRQHRLGRRQSCLRIGHAAVGLAQGLRLGRAHGRDLRCRRH